MEQSIPAVIGGVSLQAVPRDAVERRIQDLAFAEWYAENPPKPGWTSHHYLCVLRRLQTP
jgi:hypothetical protein